jgi:hypothetical protein
MAPRGERAAEDDAGDGFSQQQIAQRGGDRGRRVSPWLGETGYVERQNLVIEYRWAKGRFDLLPALAADLVGRKVDVIVATGGAPSSLAAKSATSTIPIVFVGSDPVKYGLVASLSRPSGNVTGFAVFGDELLPKRLELLSEMVPQARVIALLVNPNNPDTERSIEELELCACGEPGNDRAPLSLQLRAGARLRSRELRVAGAAGCRNGDGHHRGKVKRAQSEKPLPALGRVHGGRELGRLASWRRNGLPSRGMIEPNKIRLLGPGTGFVLDGGAVAEILSNPDARDGRDRCTLRGMSPAPRS